MMMIMIMIMNLKINHDIICEIDKIDLVMFINFQKNVALSEQLVILRGEELLYFIVCSD